jgi:hypothetical protein
LAEGRCCSAILTCKHNSEVPNPDLEIDHEGGVTRVQHLEYQQHTSHHPFNINFPCTESQWMTAPRESISSKNSRANTICALVTRYRGLLIYKYSWPATKQLLNFRTCYSQHHNITVHVFFCCIGHISNHFAHNHFVIRIIAMLEITSHHQSALYNKLLVPDMQSNYELQLQSCMSQPCNVRPFSIGFSVYQEL